MKNEWREVRLGIDAYGVSQRIPARTTIDIPPFVVSKAGDFQFYCSVSCGEGIAQSGLHKGAKRSHFDQIGTICVHKTPGDRVCMNSGPTAETQKASEEAAKSTAGATLPQEACKNIPEPSAQCAAPARLQCVSGGNALPSWACLVPTIQ